MQKNIPIYRKVSIVIPAYNAENSIKGTMESLLAQTYRNLEIIIVDDGSNDGTRPYIERLSRDHSHIKTLTLESNGGLFNARLKGADVATGDYIAFLDADDYVSHDYYRSLVEKAIETDSDMVLSEVVMDDRNIGRLFINNIANDLPFSEINNKDGFHEYMDQRGHNFIWHVAWNKLIRRDLWDKVRPYYDMITEHLVMTEDIAISTPLWFFATKTTRSTLSYHFYVKDDEGNASTAINTLGFKKAEKSIKDIVTTFSFIDTFLKKQKVQDYYTEAFVDWKKQYARIWHRNIEESPLIEGQDLLDLASTLDSVAVFNSNETSLDSKFYEITTDWNNQLDLIKDQILLHDTISFDIFDTLVVRPFYTPSDLFTLLNEQFSLLSPETTILRFSDIRIAAEKVARNESKDPDTVTLEDIYTVIERDFQVKRSISKKMIEVEVEMEVFYCTKRKTGLDLLSLATHLGKEVILTSDMYLPRNAIERILNKNGILNWSKLYISSETGTSKSNGTLYADIIKKHSSRRGDVLHIGDSPHSDVKQAVKNGLSAAHLPKTVDVFEGNKHLSSLYNLKKGSLAAHIGKEYLGVSTSLAITANRLFDNPFTPYNDMSIFNGSPSSMGYFALGMHMLGVSMWLKKSGEQNNYKNFVFLGRDGYLPEKALSLLLSAADKKHTGPQVHYMPTSRKATTPLSIRSLQDIPHLQTFITPNNKSFEKAIEILSPIIDTSKALDYLEKNNIDISKELTETNYPAFTTAIQRSFNSKKSSLLQEAFINTFGSMFTQSAVFDIGYSAKPEQIFAKITGEKIDTYFIHSYGEGASRSQDYNNVSLNTFYDFSPVVTGGLRELLISEIGPSAIKYIVKDKALSVKYDANFHTDYYERFVVRQMQNEAIRFMEDFINNFKQHLPALTFTNRYISLPYEQLLNHPQVNDLQVFSPIPFEDDIGIGKIGSILHMPTLQGDVTYGSLQGMLAGRSRFQKGIVYLALDPLRIVHKVRDLTSRLFKKHPIIHSQLKRVYLGISRAIRRRK